MTAQNPSTSTIGSESCNAMAKKGKGQRDGAKGRVHTTNGQTSHDALRNAQSHQSTMNYAAIFTGFEAMGVPMDDIKPRENVFTFNAWRGLGRCVKKGEHGVSVLTWIKRESTDSETGEVTALKLARTTTVFHISQTVEIEPTPT